MKKEKVIKYHLKNDVIDDLANLRVKIDYLLTKNGSGFDSVPCFSILPAFFKVFSHLFWNRTFDTWFKKVYE